MFFLLRGSRFPSGPARSGLLTVGLLCTLFGFAVFLAPELLAYIVGAFFLVTGLSLLGAWWKMR